MNKFRRSLAAAMCLVVGLGSFALSYVALQEVSIRESAVPAGLAWLVPIVIDGGVICGSAVIWSLSREQARRPVFPFLFVAALVVISVVVNMSHAGPSLLAKGIAALPPLVLLCTLELVAAQGRREKTQVDTSESVNSTEEVPSEAVAPAPVATFIPVQFSSSTTSPSSFTPAQTMVLPRLAAPAVPEVPAAEDVVAPVPAPSLVVERAEAPMPAEVVLVAEASPQPEASQAPVVEVPAAAAPVVEEPAELATVAMLPVQASSVEDQEVLAEVVPLRRTSAAARTRTSDTVQAPAKRTAAKTTKATPAKSRTRTPAPDAEGLEEILAPRTRTRKTAAKKTTEKAAPARKAPRIQATPPSDETL